MMNNYEVSFTINTEATWVPVAGGLQHLQGTGIVVPLDATITTPFVPGYYYQPPVNLGDPVQATWYTSDPGPGFLRVTDPETTR